MCIMGGFVLDEGDFHVRFCYFDRARYTVSNEITIETVKVHLTRRHAAASSHTRISPPTIRLLAMGPRGLSTGSLLYR